MTKCNLNNSNFEKLQHYKMEIFHFVNLEFCKLYKMINRQNDK